MNRLTDNKLVLVTRPTRLAELVVRFNTKINPEDVIARMRAEGETLCKYVIKYLGENSA